MTFIYLADASHSASRWASLAIAVAAAAVLMLIVEHQVVKHDGFRLQHLRLPVAAAVTISLVGLVVPSVSFAQEQGAPSGLPDLISDPPYIWFAENVEAPLTGETIRVLAFDGYVHNIGTGVLDVSGNPQLADGMKQRVFNGTDWEDVRSPTVRFETDDGHNHFHLIQAVDYQLWSEDRTSVIGDASKVGFCLIDTEQIEEHYDPFFPFEDSDYCGVDKPEATELSMGITPGWRDTYEANVTLQWVDISRVQPGRYWVTAETDPNDEILESNEDNNGIVFSANKFAVDGYVARDLPVQAANQPIGLKANSYGIVGDLAFVVAQGPTNGSLNVPVGVDLSSPQVIYRPAPGFTGTDSFTYYANNVASGFPLNPVEITVAIEVTEDDVATEVPAETTGTVSVASSAELSTIEPALIKLAAGDVDVAQAQWFAGGLPPGLMIDESSGDISGVPTLAGDYDVEIAVKTGDQVSRSSISIAVADGGLPPLQRINNFSTDQTRRVAMYLGSGNAGSAYEGTGLPAGVTVSTNLPLVGGVPEEIGDFDIEVREIVDGEIVDEIRFTWTVGPTTRPAFPL